MRLINKLLLLNELCRAEGRNVHPSIELRDGVELFFPLETPSVPPQPLRRRLEAAGEEGAGNEVLG